MRRAFARHPRFHIYCGCTVECSVTEYCSHERSEHTNELTMKFILLPLFLLVTNLFAWNHEATSTLETFIAITEKTWYDNNYYKQENRPEGLVKKICDEIKRLLALDANPNVSSQFGESTALHFATIAGDMNLVMQLIARGADRNARTLALALAPGATPLHLAVIEKHHEIATVLIALGVRIEVNNCHNTPHDYAHDDKDFYKFLKDSRDYKTRGECEELESLVLDQAKSLGIHALVDEIFLSRRN